MTVREFIVELEQLPEESKDKSVLVLLEGSPVLADDVEDCTEGVLIS